MSARRRALGGAVRAAAAVAAVALPAGPGQGAAQAASAPRVEMMVVGRQDELLSAPRTRTAGAAARRVGGRRCAVGTATPLAVLLGSPLSVRLKDFGSCSAKARDAGGLFVTSVSGQRNSGTDGWVYKVGSRAGTAGAADTQGSFGNGRRLRTGDRVLWFWCRLRAKGCQRTLEVTPTRRTVRAGDTFTVTVTGRDDRGKGVPVAGARVTFNGAQALTDAAGRTTLPATNPTADGAARVQAVKPGMVRAFPVSVTVTSG